MNNEDFGISSKSIPGLGSDLIDGKCSVERDLALINYSGRWTLIDSRKENVPLNGTVIRGSELGLLMKAVANDDTHTPAAINEKEFKNLTQNSKFRNLCRLIPDIETTKHVEKRSRTEQILTRALERAKVIGKGLSKIESGRYVGQDQGRQSYWIKEIYSDSPMNGREIDILFNNWNRDKTTHLSLEEWIAKKEVGRPPSETRQEFLHSICEEGWITEQKEAWEEANPGKIFNEQDFLMWQQTQRDPKLGPPTWLLKKMSGKDNDADFQVWRNELVKEREEDLDKFKEKTGLNHLSFDDFERMTCEYGRSGSIDSLERYMLLQQWEKAKSNSDTQDDFPVFVQKTKWKYETGLGKTKESFKSWMSTQEQLLHNRHEGSHLPLSFDVWRSQQDDGVLVGPAPFIRLNEEERKAYHTTCDHGVLMRNGYPFDTRFEKTLHSGEGYAIFVIGPNQDLYTGSHIGGVFHHSSFLADGAVAAAGEIKTNPDGSIAELSNKSGHYRPTDAQNLYMLRYFQARGLDLSKIDFTLYDEKGDKKTQKALIYLQKLEHIESLGKIDSGLFT